MVDLQRDSKDFYPGRVFTLRSDLVVEPVSRGAFVAQIIDRRFSRRILLDATAFALLSFLNGERDMGSILIGLELKGIHMRLSLLQKTLAFFQDYGLFEDGKQGREQAGRGQGVAEEEKHVVIKDAAEPKRAALEISFLENAVHNCRACGRCCRGYTFGPLSPNEVKRIKNLRLPGGRLHDAARVVEKEYKKKTCKVLETDEEGACVFLDRDKKCMLHREGGGEAKPWFCRLFPLQFVLAPDGRIFGGLYMECFSYHKARRGVRSLAEKETELREILHAANEIPILSSTIKAGEKRALSFRRYCEAEKAFLDVLKSPHVTIDEALFAIAQMIRFLEKGGTSLEGFIASPPESTFAENDGLMHAVCSFLSGCVLVSDKGAFAGQGEETQEGMRLFFLETVDFFSGEGDPALFLPAEQVAGPRANSECMEILREFLCNEIFSKEWYRTGDLRLGFALTLVRYFLLQAGSRLLAHRHGEKAVTPATLCAAMAMILRNMRRKRIEEIEEAFLHRDSSLLKIYTALQNS